MTKGKMERWHRSLKNNVVELDIYYYPWKLEQLIASFAKYFNMENLAIAVDTWNRVGHTLPNR